MKRYFYSTCIFLLLISCNNEISFKKVESLCRYNGSRYSEAYLVTNAPREKIKRDSVLLTFAKSKLPNFCKLDSTTKTCSIHLYKNTRCTRNFDKFNKGYSYSLSDDIEGCLDDEYSVFLYYKRDENNHKKWFLFLPRNLSDTICCE